MPKYTLNRDYLLRTTNGVIEFKKGEPAWVPPHMERDAVNIGAEPLEGDGPELIAPETPKLPDPTPDERKSQCFVAFDMLVERNDAKDFTGQGVPTVKATESIVGFSVERAEVNEYWAEYRVKDSQ